MSPRRLPLPCAWRSLRGAHNARAANCFSYHLAMSLSARSCIFSLFSASLRRENSLSRALSIAASRLLSARSLSSHCLQRARI